MTTQTLTMQQKRGSASYWASSSLILLPGEIGYDTTNNIIKIGNGTNTWSALSGLTVSVSAGTLTGTTLNSTVTASSLTSVGTLSSLNVSGAIGVGSIPSYGSAGQVLTSAGAGLSPSWTNVSSGGLSASNYITIGYLSSNQTVTSGADVSPSFVASSDPQSWWNATTKRFAPNIAGYYQIDYFAHWQTGTATAAQVNIQIQKNNTNTVALFQEPINTNTGAASLIGGSKIVYLNGSTDYINFTAYTANSPSQILTGTSDGSWTHFSASLVTSGANMTSNSLIFGTNGLIATSGSSPWNGSSAATIDIDITKVPRLSSANTFSGSTTLRSGTAADGTAPLYFQSGTNLTNVAAGAMEFDGQVVSITPNTSMGRTPLSTTIFTSGIGTTGVYNSATNYTLFPSSNDTITLPIGTYRIEYGFRLDVAGSTTSAVLQFSIKGGGTAVGTISTTAQGAAGLNSATTSITGSNVALTSIVSVSPASAISGRQYVTNGTGILRITTAGTIIPSYQFSATLVSATSSTLYSDNYLMITPISNSSTTASTGAWA